METKNTFREHLNKSSEIARAWPSWKQNAPNHVNKTVASDNRVITNNHVSVEKKAKSD